MLLNICYDVVQELVTVQDYEPRGYPQKIIVMKSAPVKPSRDSLAITEHIYTYWKTNRDINPTDEQKKSLINYIK